MEREDWRTINLDTRLEVVAFQNILLLKCLLKKRVGLGGYWSLVVSMGLVDSIGNDGFSNGYYVCCFCDAETAQNMSISCMPCT